MADVPYAIQTSAMFVLGPWKLAERNVVVLLSELTSVRPWLAYGYVNLFYTENAYNFQKPAANFCYKIHSDPLYACPAQGPAARISLR